MRNLFTYKNSAIIGIDISETSINAIELSYNNHTYCLEGYGQQSLPAGVVENNLIKDTLVVAESLKQLLINSNLQGKSAVIAVPDACVITKIIQLPDNLRDDEIAELVISEIDKDVPYPIHEMNIDFKIMGDALTISNTHNVLIVATHNENISSRLEVLNQVNLYVKIVDIESYARERAIRFFSSSSFTGFTLSKKLNAEKALSSSTSFIIASGLALRAGNL